MYFDCMSKFNVKAVMFYFSGHGVEDPGPWRRMLASSVLNCGFMLCSDQTKVYEMSICCFSDKHATIRRNRQNTGERSCKKLSWPSEELHQTRQFAMNHVIKTTTN